MRISDWSSDVCSSDLIIDLPPSSWYYVSCKADDPEAQIIENFLRDCVARRPRRGFGKCFTRSRRMGYVWNHKRVYRIYKLLGNPPLMVIPQIGRASGRERVCRYG